MPGIADAYSQSAMHLAPISYGSVWTFRSTSYSGKAWGRLSSQTTPSSQFGARFRWGIFCDGDALGTVKDIYTVPLLRRHRHQRPQIPATTPVMLTCHQIRTGPRSNPLEGLNSNRQGRKDRSSYSGHYRQTALTVSLGEPVTVRALTPGPLSTGDTCRETRLSSFPSQTSDVQRLGFEQDRHR